MVDRDSWRRLINQDFLLGSWGSEALFPVWLRNAAGGGVSLLLNWFLLEMIRNENIRGILDGWLGKVVTGRDGTPTPLRGLVGKLTRTPRYLATQSNVVLAMRKLGTKSLHFFPSPGWVYCNWTCHVSRQDAMRARREQMRNPLRQLLILGGLGGHKAHNPGKNMALDHSLKSWNSPLTSLEGDRWSWSVKADSAQQVSCTFLGGCQPPPFAFNSNWPIDARETPSIVSNPMIGLANIDLIAATAVSERLRGTGAAKGV